MEIEEDGKASWGKKGGDGVRLLKGEERSVKEDEGKVGKDEAC